MPTATRGVVLGASMAGILAASVLARHLDHVTVVERDPVRDTAAPRRGVPQARHAHLLWSGGARAVESLLPGTGQDWLDAGAHRIGMPDGVVTMTAQGWLPRWPEMQYLICCSRDLLDLVVRRRVLTNDRIAVRSSTRAVRLLGDATRISGVELRDESTGQTSEIDADLLVDATGRGSQTPQWLVQLGLPPVRDESVDSGLAYASRTFRAPSDAVRGFPLVNVQANPREGRPGRTATLVPIEDGRWLVTLSGTRGGEPSLDQDEFVPFARAVRHPIVGDLIAGARPLTPVYASRSTANIRHFYDRLPSWPDGLVVLGDALASYNPVYGQGLSVIAHSVAVLEERLRIHGFRPDATRRIQRDVARIVDGAWTVATGQDALYPGAIGRRPNLIERGIQRYVDRLVRTATSRPVVARALIDAFTLSGPMTRLIAPAVAAATLAGPRHAPPIQPPMTDEERQRATSAGWISTADTTGP